MAPPLTPEQQAEAEHLFQQLRAESDQRLRAMCELMARRPINKLLGQTEFELRDELHKLGAVCLEAAADHKKRGLSR